MESSGSPNIADQSAGGEGETPGGFEACSKEPNSNLLENGLEDMGRGKGKM